jgi:hypothetical protein
MQKTQKIVDPAGGAEAVLSHTSPQQPDHVAAREFDPVDQAHDHPHVRQHGRTGHSRLAEHHPVQPQFRFRRCAAGGQAEVLARWAGLAGRACRRACRRAGWRDLRIGRRLRGAVRGGLGLTATIKPFLLALPGGRSIVRRAAPVGTLPAVLLPAAERTPQIPPPGVARMREKPNPAVRAVGHATSKCGMRLQNRVQRGLVVLNKRPGAVVPVPIHAKREKSLDGYGKKARFSAIIENVLCTPSSYLIGAKASSGRARFFVRYGKNSRCPPAQTLRPLSLAQAVPTARSTQTRATS